MSNKNKNLTGQEGENIMSENDLLKEEILETEEEWTPMGTGGISSIAGNINVVGITISKSTLELIVNGTYQLTACVCPTDATNQAVTWSSSNNSVATVNSSGLVCAKSAGTAVITAKACDTSSGCFSATCNLIVVAPVPVNSVEITEPLLTVRLNETHLLQACIYPTNATNKAVTWSSSNPNIAVVNSSSGLVCAKSVGLTTITATTVDGGKTSTCCVTVVIGVDEVIISSSAETLNVNNTIQLNTCVLPFNATDQRITWTSNNPYIADVGLTSGLVCARSKGNALITATSVEGSKSAACLITVGVPVDEVTVSPTDLSLTVGEVHKMYAAVLPANAVNQAVTWSSDDSNVVEVDPIDGLIYANDVGTANIIATSEEDNQKTASCCVTVTPVIAVIGVSISPTSAEFYVNEVKQLTAIIAPTDATNQAVTWSSDNPDIIVDEDGTVFAESAGAAVITVVTDDGEWTANCDVTVNPVISVTGIEISETELELDINEIRTLTANVIPEDATNEDILWASSNIFAVDVDCDTGTIYAKSGGKAVITARTIDGDFIAECIVTVNIPQFDLGNSSSNIIHRGRFADHENYHYFASDEGLKLTISVDEEELEEEEPEEEEELEEIILSEDGSCANLNVFNNELYYTTYAATEEELEEEEEEEVRGVITSVKKSNLLGENEETLFEINSEIQMMYVINNEYITFLSDGDIYSYSFDSGEFIIISKIPDIVGFIPTPYGNIYAKGEMFNYTLYAEDEEILNNVESYYSDIGYLVVSINNIDFQIKFDRCFNAFDEDTDMEEFNLYGQYDIYELLPDCDDFEDENDEAEEEEEKGVMQTGSQNTKSAEQSSSSQSFKTGNRINQTENYPTIVYDGLTEQKKVIWNYYDTVNNRNENPDGDWETRVNLTAPSEREIRYAFSSNEINRESHLGIFNIESAGMVYIKQIETAPASQYEYAGALLETYLIGLNCTVFNSDDIFTFNGINFDEVLLECVDGRWYILENRSVSTEVLEELGNELLTEAAITHNGMNQMNKTFQLNMGTTVLAAAPPMHPDTSNNEPPDIYILLTKPSSKPIGSIDVPDFNTYLKKTLHNEMGSGHSYIAGSSRVPGISEPQYNEGMKACAMGLKMYAWWCRSVHAKHKNEGAHMCDSSSCCQSYGPDNNPEAWVVNAISNISTVGVRTSSDGILFSHYRAGDWTSTSGQNTGLMYQRGAFKLASKGYDYKQILKYYYSNVPNSISPSYPAYPNTISRGEIKFFTVTNGGNNNVVRNPLTTGQKNVVTRAKSMVDITWTALEKITGWRSTYTFNKGSNYVGIPYGWPVNKVNGSWVGDTSWNRNNVISVNQFLSETKNSNSQLYKTKGTYDKYVFPYYSNDCSTFTSHALGLPNRYTTDSFNSLSVKGIKKMANDVNIIKVGDIINARVYGKDADGNNVLKIGHVILITDVARNSKGELVHLEIMEQTPPIARRVVKTGSDAVTYMKARFNEGYILYRYDDINNVPSEPSNPVNPPSNTNTDSTLKITGENYPSILEVGKIFSIKGSITSNYNINNVTVGVYTTSGAAKTSKSVVPNITPYNISDLDAFIKFNTLPAGTYIYRITAQDSEKTVTAQREFTVSQQATLNVESTLKITGENYPSTLEVGKIFSIKGSITSNYNIKSVVVGVYTTSGLSKTSKAATPNAKSYNISSLDSYITFNTLPVGTYIYQITVGDEKKTVTAKKQFTVTSTQASTLAIASYNYPASLNNGAVFSIKGMVTSNYNITNVTAGVYTTSGAATAATSKSVVPNTQSYNIANLDKYILFNKLSAGTYVYKIVATDAKQTLTLVSKTFTVGTPNVSPASTLAIGTYAYPTTLNIGQVFSVNGTISSNYNITNVTVGVYTTSGTSKTSKSVTPNATTYNVKNVDNYILFNSLAAGTYVYKIIATDQKQTLTLASKTFTVGSATSTLAIGTYTCPTTLQAGKVFSISGTISSNYNITNVTVGVYTTSGGSTPATSKSVTPNAKSYNVKGVDNYILFNKLTAGTYVYKITAKDEKQTLTLVSKTFTVT